MEKAVAIIIIIDDDDKQRGIAASESALAAMESGFVYLWTLSTVGDVVIGRRFLSHFICGTREWTKTNAVAGNLSWRRRRRRQRGVSRRGAADL